MAHMVKFAIAGMIGLTALKAAPALDSVAPMLVSAASAAGAPSKDATDEAPKEAAESKEAPKEAQPVDVLPELLGGIHEERALLEAWRADLELKEAEISLARSAMQKQMGDLEALHAELERLLDRASRENTEDVAQLVEMYNAMKPAQAAAILDDGDMEVTTLVLAAMAPRDSGPIMAFMNPVRARAISQIILQRSRLPGDQNLVNLRVK